ncbi:MAG: fumarylacetoacetate hydrolase family protein [Thiomonas sp.]|uniref:fumarylacetoacetate hydrolase family protein n=1 Tax=Thiomonas sp. TaxID=2047785 RepID=UPI002A35E9BD|nr:fumarylacetoacetate hydrolase family protein [Thiomonas sp.]MDY0328962.1 fumarylacetoacetate hydrolase family protein [Thiomonas sp.]
MRLATLKTSTPDGRLVVVNDTLTQCQPVPDIAPTLQAALDDWARCAPMLRAAALALQAGTARHAQPFDTAACHSPLPRAYQWADGSAYLNHVELVRKARKAEVPATFYTDPLMYQGGSDSFIGPCDPIVAKESWGIDFEAEVAVITGEVPLGATPTQAAQAIRLVLLVNDVSLRHLIPAELAKGFGFFQSKPASAFSPVALTPDELGAAWRDHKLHRPLRVEVNGQLFGQPNAGVDMTFDFAQLIAHAAKTRRLAAGTIIGSGTVSNKQGGLWGSKVEHGGVGYACLAEVRTYETIEQGEAVTPFLRDGDVVEISMHDERGSSLFGSIRNRVQALAE